MPTLEELDRRITELSRRLSEVQSSSPRLVFNIANLRPQRDFSDFLIHPRFAASGDLEIHVDIRNDGNRDSGPFWVLTTVTLGSATSSDFTRIKNLPAHTTQSWRLAVVPAADIPVTGTSLCVAVHVDPPQPGMPAGEVVESDSTDNYDRECVFIPASSVKPPRPEDFEERPERPEP